MHCEKCGARHGTEAKFCVACGATLKGLDSGLGRLVHPALGKFVFVPADFDGGWDWWESSYDFTGSGRAAILISPADYGAAKAEDVESIVQLLARVDRRQAEFNGGSPIDKVLVYKDKIPIAEIFFVNSHNRRVMVRIDFDAQTIKREVAP